MKGLNKLTACAIVTLIGLAGVVRADNEEALSLQRKAMHAELAQLLEQQQADVAAISKQIVTSKSAQEQHELHLRAAMLKQFGQIAVLELQLKYARQANASKQVEELESAVEQLRKSQPAPAVPQERPGQ